jgi:hypothetical protein
MSNKDLKLTPHQLTKEVDQHGGETWWYEEPGGICIVHEIYDQGVHERTDLIKIPWRSIRAALQRKDKP